MKTKITFLNIFLLSFLLPAQIQIGNDIDGEALSDRFGFSVSLSGDGTTVAAGAPFNDENGGNSGHVRVFFNNLGNWTQVANDIDGEAGSDNFGFSTSLSQDGNTVAIGAPFNDGNGLDSGHVRVFQLIGGSWIQIGSDIDGEAAFDRFGYSVSLSSSGNVLAVGAPFNNGVAGSNTGHVRVFQNIGGNWSQIGSDIDGEAVSDQSGISVSLSSDGATVAIGANRNDDGGPNAGQVRVYENIGGTWTQAGSDIDGEATSDQSGISISLSDNAQVLAVGAPFNDGNGEDSGHTRVFQDNSTGWIQIGDDIDGELAFDQFDSRNSVSLSQDGSILAVGAPLNDGNGANSGHVRVFKNISGVWTQIGVDIDGESSDDQSGTSVSISSDGSVLAIGADFNSSGFGHVRLYDLSNILSLNDVVQNALSAYPNPAKSSLNLESYNPISEVLIFNVFGQEIKRIEVKGLLHLKINVSDYSVGHYFAKVILGDKTETIRFIKQ